MLKSTLVVDQTVFLGNQIVKPDGVLDPTIKTGGIYAFFHSIICTDNEILFYIL